MARCATVNVELVALSVEDRPLLDRLGQLYQYDFSEFDGTEIGEEGLFRWWSLEHLFAQPEHHAFLVRVDGNIAGFAATYEGEAFRDPTERVWWMDEFFVMRKYRRTGVGNFVARSLFDRLPGTWEVAQISPNTAAQSFWRKVIAEYTDGNFDEIEMADDRWTGPVQYFETR